MENSENESEKEYSPLLESMEVKDEEMTLEEQIAKKIRDGFIIKVLGIVLYQITIFFQLYYLVIRLSLLDIGY